MAVFSNNHSINPHWIDSRGFRASAASVARILGRGPSVLQHANRFIVDSISIHYRYWSSLHRELLVKRAILVMLIEFNN